MVLVSVDYRGNLTSQYYAADSDRLFTQKYACSDDPTCAQILPSVEVHTTDGAYSQVLDDAILAGNVRGGIVAASGNVFNPYIAIAQGYYDKPCDGTAWTLYDSATMKAVDVPDFGVGSCAKKALLSGPNASLLTGDVPDASGAGTSAFSLYYPTTSPVLKKLGHYLAPPGSLSIQVVPVFGNGAARRIPAGGAP